MNGRRLWNARRNPVIYTMSASRAREFAVTDSISAQAHATRVPRRCQQIGTLVSRSGRAHTSVVHPVEAYASPGDTGLAAEGRPASAGAAVTNRVAVFGLPSRLRHRSSVSLAGR